MILRSFSLFELLIALGIFAITAFFISILILRTYLSFFAIEEMVVANFLAKEGIEAVRSIRDASWEALLPGSHGLAILDGKWVLQEKEEALEELKAGKRIVEIEEIDSQRKKIISKIIWKDRKGTLKEISLSLQLTNWKD